MKNLNPCKRDCPRRSPTCHSECKEYLEFRAELDQKCLKRKLNYENAYFAYRSIRKEREKQRKK